MKRCLARVGQGTVCSYNCDNVTCTSIPNQLEKYSKRQCVDPANANMPAKLGGYWTKVCQIFIKRRRVIGGVKASIHPASILLSIVECQHTE